MILELKEEEYPDGYISRSFNDLNQGYWEGVKSLNQWICHAGFVKCKTGLSKVEDDILTIMSCSDAQKLCV